MLCLHNFARILLHVPTVQCGALGSIRRHCPPNFVAPRNFVIKHKIKTKILTPENVFYPPKPQNLVRGLVQSQCTTRAKHLKLFAKCFTRTLLTVCFEVDCKRPWKGRHVLKRGPVSVDRWFDDGFSGNTLARNDFLDAALVLTCFRF